MKYKDTLEYMYNLLPMYQKVGKSAFKKDLTNTLKLCARLGDPHKKFKSVHIAGTNGKGSSAHMIASILQSAGYKTGLYTSPHLKNFTERIKVDGQEVNESFVVEFVEKLRNSIEKIRPSFFELTVTMAFDYFAEQEVDIAVIEVGLGGRFDSTNVITPVVSLITSIGLDHTDMLGETLPEIAFEKAGIIKDHIPVVISETQHEIVDVFNKKALQLHAPIYYADQEFEIKPVSQNWRFQEIEISDAQQSFMIETDLLGEYQVKNVSGVIKTLDILNSGDFIISENQVKEGFKKVIRNTGFYGRWQVLCEDPLTVCDTAHNEAGVALLFHQITGIKHSNLHVVWGTVEGKNLGSMFRYFPKKAYCYFCEANIPRALKAEKLFMEASDFGIRGEIVKNVNDALTMAKRNAKQDDLILVGGSNFIVAEIGNLIS